MRVLTSPPADDPRRLRHTVAAAIERLRALNLAPGDAATAGEVACTALGALSTALFVGGDSAGPRVPASLVEDEIRRVAVLLGLDPQAAGQPSACVCLSDGLPPEPSTVAP
jgi:hypothetical protein